MKNRKLIKIRLSSYNKYTRLLITLIFLFFIPVLITSKIGIAIFSFVKLTAILTAVKTFLLRPKDLYLCIVLACLALVGDLIYLSAPESYTWLAFIAHLISSGFLIVSILFITRDIVTSKKVNRDTIIGSISIYLLIGILWFLVYLNIQLFDVNAFSYLGKAVQKPFDLLYFSFTTLTTVGYGDIVPVNSAAKAFANMEGIFGVLFPAVFIAKLVGNLPNS
ncbi:MAG: hypothetical protein KI793_20860 [Rivularia sp. (in: Bacteria)]|nr:hypothetical protein [Rivularia sp. MS3]